MSIGKDYEDINRGNRLEEARQGIIDILKKDEEAAMDCFDSDAFDVKGKGKIDYSSNSPVRLNIEARENDPSQC